MSMDPASQRFMAEQEQSDAERRAAAGWRRLGRSVRSIGPGALGRFLLVLAAAGVVVWLAVGTWPALLPFVIGGAVAYAVLPLVNALDHVVPRWLAATLAVLAVLAVVALAAVALVRPLLDQVLHLYRSQLSVADIRHLVQQLDQRLSTLPPVIRTPVRAQLLHLTLSLRAGIGASFSGLVSRPLASFFGVINVIGALLGLLVLPVWTLLVLRDQRAAAVALDRRLPRWLAPDLWAVLRILDRAFGVFLRGLVVQGIAVGLAIYVGLTLLGREGLLSTRYPVALAVLAGVLQLVPVVGPLIATIPPVLVGLTQSPRAALAAAALYLVVQLLMRNVASARLQRRVMSLHPVLLLLVLVALSQIGPVWTLLALPVTMVARDLFQYAYGRLGAPPRPAGLLPEQPLPAAPATAPRRTPLVYRRGRERRQAVGR